MNSSPVFFDNILNAQFFLPQPRWFIVISCHCSVSNFTSGLYTYIKAITLRRKTKTERKSYFSLLSSFLKLFWGKEERQQQSDYASARTSHEKHNIQIQSD